MSDFKCSVEYIRFIEPIPGADFLELAVIGEYRSVTKKGQYKANQKCVYIPESAVLPENLVAEMGLQGYLAGKEKNRVKAIRLRGCLSQGIVYRARWVNLLPVGRDVASRLGVHKYEPPVPSCLRGQVSGILRGSVLAYDIENIKRYPALSPDELRAGQTNIFDDDELIYLEEKVHGTLFQAGFLPHKLDKSEVLFDNWFIISKGLGAQGLAFKNVEDNRDNLYIKTALQKNLLSSFSDAIKKLHYDTNPVYVFGEIFGTGVQDLHYGMKTPEFRLFDVYVGTIADGHYLDFYEKMHFCAAGDIAHMPVLYVGAYSYRTVLEHTTGREQVSGRKVHMREGVVIRPLTEGRHPLIGRKILKSVSGDYLTRKGEITEYT